MPRRFVSHDKHRFDIGRTNPDDALRKRNNDRKDDGAQNNHANYHADCLSHSQGYNLATSNSLEKISSFGMSPASFKNSSLCIRNSRLSDSTSIS